MWNVSMCLFRLDRSEKVLGHPSVSHGNLTFSLIKNQCALKKKKERNSLPVVYVGFHTYFLVRTEPATNIGTSKFTGTTSVAVGIRK